MNGKVAGKAFDLKTPVQLRCLYSQEELSALWSVYPNWKQIVRQTELIDLASKGEQLKNVQNHISPIGKPLEVTATEKDTRYSDCIITLIGSVNDVSLGMFNLLKMFQDQRVISKIGTNEYDNHYLNRFLFPAEMEFFKTVKDLKELCFFRMLIKNTDISKVFGKQGNRIDGLRQKYDLRMKASRFRLPQSDDRVLEVEGLTKNIVDALVEINNLILYEENPNPSSRTPTIDYIPHLHKNAARKRKRSRPRKDSNNQDIDESYSSDQEHNHYENFDDIASDGTRITKPRSRASSHVLTDAGGNSSGTGKSNNHGNGVGRTGNNKDSKNVLRSPIKIVGKEPFKANGMTESPDNSYNRGYTPKASGNGTSNNSINNHTSNNTRAYHTSPTLSDAQFSPSMDKYRSTSPISKPIMKHNPEGSDSEEQMFIDIILIPEDYVGRLVGKGGKRLVSLRKFTRTRIIIGDKGNDDSKYRKFTITSADEKNVEKAKELLQDNLIEEQRRDREKLEKKIKKHLMEDET
ncbi:C-rich single-stranded DNA binding [Nakaseomyces bracarensis]|uniref:C-rich single-stranded DNA binding n=1 Tax=Nakaseomyces bracarensis TaxID=273131 RepID=A0ABR4P055_9SACH